MNLPEFDAAIQSRLAGWTPAPIVLDNEPSPDNVIEFIRFTVLHGVGFIDEPTGVYSVNGSTVLHPFILNFNVFTAINTAKTQSSLLCQAILDHWQVRDLGQGLTLLAGGIQRIGEEPPRYHTVVQISGTREERLTKRA